MNMNITVYTQNGCRPCGELKSFLEEEGYTFELKNISTNKDYKEEVVALGAMATPVTVVDEKVFMGYNSEVKEQLLEALSE
jgi:glutaredoxin